MSSSIVIALPKIEDAKKIRTILNRHGLTVASVCSSVSNALASISELDSGVLICGYKLTDAYYKDALDNLPQYFEMLLLASQRIIDEAPNSVSTVQMPMKASVLVDTVNDMLYHLERRIKKETKAQIRKRTELYLECQTPSDGKKPDDRRGSISTHPEMQHGFRNQHGRNCTDVTHADV